MKEIKDAEFENIIIDCSIDILEEVLRQAQQVGIMSEKNKIIVTSLVIIKRFLSFSSRDKGGNFVWNSGENSFETIKTSSQLPFQDLQTIDLEPYQYSGVNFTGVRLIDPDNPIVLDIVKMHEAEWGLDNPRQLRVEPALMYDAVQLFARAFKQLKDSIEGDVKKLPCNDTINWEHGYSLSNFMRVVSWTRII